MQSDLDKLISRYPQPGNCTGMLSSYSKAAAILCNTA